MGIFEIIPFRTLCLIRNTLHLISVFILLLNMLPSNKLKAVDVTIFPQFNILDNNLDIIWIIIILNNSSMALSVFIYIILCIPMWYV